MTTKCSLTVILTLLVVAGASAYGSRGALGGRKRIEDVESDKEVQDLGEYAVVEYNRRSKDGGGELEFRRVVEAEKQVVSGLKYYLKIEAADSGGMPARFEAEVVVQPWRNSKQLLEFGPSLLTK